MITESVRDLMMLLARLVIGVTFIAHGLLKVEDVPGAIAGFRAGGIPLPTLSYWFTVIVEFGGGAAMIVGLALPLVGVLFAVVTGGAMVFVHGPQGFYVHEQGYEYVLVLAVVSLALGASGGRIALDELLARRWSTWAWLTGRSAHARRESVPA
ncbi:putative oxidoreductase [Saccharothrix ecbatanensis]|uniref:Putative oxidoreductase n=1 Tax=Saccharothrix ecbatanensis TaxID=1105145 RepID=A0A7W9M0U1_9PSEU|nr:DoxX family protein [Saccharothrix ecbatanensis]MBB5803216.1 putative oxidoreductase [Saccharothrix ecbatanensis]